MLFLPPGILFSPSFFSFPWKTPMHPEDPTQLSSTLSPGTLSCSLICIPIRTLALLGHHTSTVLSLSWVCLPSGFGPQCLAPKSLNKCLQNERDLNQKNETHMADFRDHESRISMTYPLLGFDTWLHHSCKWAFLCSSYILRKLDGSTGQLVL